MKICFCVSSFPALSQTFVTSQVIHAVKQGHEVTVACKAFDDTTPLSPERKSVLRNVRIVIWPSPHPQVLKALPNSLADRIVVRLDRSAWRRQIDADLVIAHFGYRGTAVARAQRNWKTRPPLVTIYHGRDVSVEYRRNALSRYRMLFEEGDLHVAVNTPFAHRLIDCGAPKARVETRHLGIPVSDYPFEPAELKTPLRLFSVCRLVEKKGLATAIDALALLREKHPEIDWRYDIGGDGPLAEDLHTRVIQLGLGETVHFLGALSHEHALKRMRDTDILLAPSCTAEDGDQEGIPVTLMEAMALGTPVCATRHSGIPELVEHNATGLLSEEKDPNGLCRNIAALAGDPHKARTLSVAARKMVEQAFNEDLQNVRFLERCLELVKDSEMPEASPISIRS